ncbi:exonuclease SbcCD subunit D [Nonomuraea sediminis]|uniref:exonuclease SbcCD subunit D n=1 Tax=Nonomuraea sediminis TaxID=2835864 RepID=UPI00202A64E8|nr:exonuclease SbcCD subunit D [Nonomuraea sediminis]
MRILHTSDWHLGRSFHRESLLDAQAAFVDHLVGTVHAERVDVVAIAGDVYDRALPPVDAVSLLQDALRRIVGAGAKVVLISGNHDSARRLGFGADLLDAAGVYLRTEPSRAWDPIVLDDVAFYGIPYLEPELVRAPWELSERTHSAALGHAMSRIRLDAVRHRRSVVLAHAFVTGGEASDSERDISVGGVAHVPLSAFDGVDYAALGHLHGRQRMSGTVRYSGSPLAYSFSEAGQVKGCWLVTLSSERARLPRAPAGTEQDALFGAAEALTDVAAGGPPYQEGEGLHGGGERSRGGIPEVEVVRAPGGAVTVEFVAAPVPRPIGRLRGTIDDLLTLPSYETYEDHWLQVTLTDPVRPKSAMDRLRARFPHTLALSFEPSGPQAKVEQVRLSGRPEAEVALDFVREVRGEPAAPDEEDLLRQAIEASRVKETMA